jgi:hypothetical protein
MNAAVLIRPVERRRGRLHPDFDAGESGGGEAAARGLDVRVIRRLDPVLEERREARLPAQPIGASLQDGQIPLAAALSREPAAWL